MRPVRVAVAGSVDDGKSTLLGRLMCDADRVFEDELEAVTKSSLSPRGEGSLNLAFFTDGLMLERREGITLDVAWKHLTLGTRRLLLADVPGHAELVHNMATGASTADAALLLVDAERGVQPQTRRHLLMLSGLGVSHVIVCVNKMDAVGFQEVVVSRLSAELRALAADLEVIPVSALEGDNIVHRSECMPWYSGPTVAQRLQMLEPIPPPAFTRAVVQLGSDEDGWTALHVLSGTISQGEVLTTWPERSECRVVECSPHGAGRVRLASPAQRGVLLTSALAPPHVSARVTVLATWLGPKESGGQLSVLQHGRTTVAHVSGSTLNSGEVGHLELQLERVTWFDTWNESRATASCLLVDAEGRTVAGARFV